MSKVDSLSLVSSIKTAELVTKPETKSNIEVFENNNTKNNIDELNISNKNPVVDSEEKTNNKKKWLIGAGIALGTIAIGVAGYLLFKKFKGNISPEKYLSKNCDVFKEGNYTVIQHKKGGIVDVSKIGDLNNNGTIIRYRSPEQAKQGAIDALMKHFDSPIGQQREQVVAVLDNDLHLGMIGDATSATKPGIAHPFNHSKGKVDLFHNHPSLNRMGTTAPLSGNDITSTCVCECRSITAVNSFGEYSTVKIIDANKVYKDYGFISGGEIGNALGREIAPRMMGNEGKRLLELRSLKEQNLLSSDLIEELKQLELKAENFKDRDLIKFMNEHFDDYCTILHKAYQKILPQFGIEYTTNFSNLA